MALGPTLQKKLDEYKATKAKIAELQAKDWTLTHQQAFKLAKKELFQEALSKSGSKLLSMDFSEIEKQIMAAMAVPVGLVDPSQFYDYHGLLPSSGKSVYDKYAAISSEMKELAKKFDKPVLLSTPTSKHDKFLSVLSPPGGKYLQHEGTVTGKMHMPGPMSQTIKKYQLPPASHAFMALSVNYGSDGFTQVHLEDLATCVFQANQKVAFQLQLSKETALFFSLSFEHEFDHAHKKVTLGISGNQPVIAELEASILKGWSALISQMSAGEAYHINSFSDVIAHYVMKALYSVGVPGKYPATILPKYTVNPPEGWKKGFDKALDHKGSATVMLATGAEPEVVHILGDIEAGKEYQLKFSSGSLVTGTEGKPVGAKDVMHTHEIKFVNPHPALAEGLVWTKVSGTDHKEPEKAETDQKVEPLSPLAAMGLGVED